MARTKVELEQFESDTATIPVVGQLRDTVLQLACREIVINAERSVKTLPQRIAIAKRCSYLVRWKLIGRKIGGIVVA